MSDTTQELKPLPPPPPNGAALTVRPGPDGVHTFVKINYDVTHFSDDKQKLLLHMLTNAIGQLSEAVEKMGRIEAAKRLAVREAIHRKGNGQ